MSKEEIVRLVCRALSIIQVVTAVIEMAYLPEHFAMLAIEAKRGSDLVAGERIGLAFLFFRIAFLLVVAAILWNCGPRLQRMMATVQSKNEQEQSS